VQTLDGVTGRDALFMLVLSTPMLPPQVTVIPKFIIFRTLYLELIFRPFSWWL
jgi:ABC-type glycerol-3-phosphate transport system permease component